MAPEGDGPAPHPAVSPSTRYGRTVTNASRFPLCHTLAGHPTRDRSPISSGSPASRHPRIPPSMDSTRV